MSLHTLTIGTLHCKPERRTGASSGKGYVTAQLRTSAGEGASVFLRLAAFSETAGAALLALDAGDAVAVAGELKLTAWVDREGNARPSADLVVGQVLTPYAAKKKRAAVAAAGGEPAQAPAPRPQSHAAESGFGREDEAWLKGDGA
jgi:single-stranded DNA-binding protein